MAPLEYTAVSIVPLGANTNPVDCMVRVGVGECPGRGCHGISVRAVPDRETQVMLGYQRRTRRLVIDREGHHLHPHLGKRAVLAVAHQLHRPAAHRVPRRATAPDHRSIRAAR